MTNVTIQNDSTESTARRFRAIAGKHQSVGSTPGQALDALNAELGNADSGALVIIQQIGTDPYFSESQYLRMRELLDRQELLTAPERAELEELVRDELTASAERSKALADALAK